MKLNKQSGQALVGTAVAMVVLAGFAGLAIDMGTLRYQKRLQQTAADSAAIAGASNLLVTSGGVTAGAQNASGQNGFTDNGGGQVSTCTAAGAAIGTVCVQVNNPPNATTDTAHGTDPAYVEVFVSVVQPTYFMKIFGVNSQVVTARAVATNAGGGPDSGCLYTLGPPTASIEGVNINGSATLNAPTCGIADNGNYNTQGNALVVTAATFGVSGSDIIKGGGGSVTCTQNADPTECPSKSAPAKDPLLGLAPLCSGCTGGTSLSISGSGTYTINPGTYTSITIQGAGGGNSSGCTTTGANVTFTPGQYIFTGAGLSVTGNAVISGTGVMFYFTNTATVSITGNPDVHLTAPSSGTYAGILMYQDPNDTNVGPFPNGPIFGGDDCSVYSGALYFPSDQLTFYGTSSSTSSATGPTYAVVISDSLAFSGHPTVNLVGNAALPAGVSLVKNAILVE